MSCQEAFFERAHCRIDLESTPGLTGAEHVVATVSVVDDDAQALRPLVFDDGARVSIAGDSEALALGTTLTYLEGKFGALTESAYGCAAPTTTLPIGEPMVVEGDTGRA